MTNYPHIKCTITNPFGKDLEVRDFYKDLAYYKANTHNPLIYPLLGLTYGEVYEDYVKQLEAYGMKMLERQLAIVNALLHDFYSFPSQFGCILVELGDLEGREREELEYHLSPLIKWLENNSPFLGFLSDDFSGIDRITERGIILSHGLVISRYAYLLEQISKHIQGKGKMDFEMWDTVLGACEYLAVMDWYEVTLRHKVDRIEFTPIRKKIGDHFFKPQKNEGKFYWILDQEGKGSVRELVD